MEKYLENLNEMQLKAVQTTDGPVLVLAGAGTGKTQVLVSRFVHLLKSKHLKASQILAVTFTNKAAQEMKSRIQNLIQLELQNHWIGTFHKICLKIIREYTEYLPINSFFTIIDKSDQKKIIKKILCKFNIDSRLVGYVIDRLDKFKNNNNQSTSNSNINLNNTPELTIFNEYQSALVEANACDFNDLILYCIQLWQEHPEVLEKYQEQIPYIMIDEYQDTNLIQYQWVSLLAQKHKNVCCVGDEDQTIYTWRGADVNNILNFNKDFENAQIILLEENYRSSQSILDVANCIIAKNKQRLGKKLFAHKKETQPVRIIGTFNEKEEANLISQQIQTIQKHTSHKLSDIVILVRATFQIGAIEEALFYYGIPYQVIGSRKFYEFQEIRDLTSYLGLIYNNDSNMHFLRIINTPKRGVGGITLQKIEEYAQQHQLSLFMAVKQMLIQELLSAKIQKNLQEFTKIINYYTTYHATMPLDELLKLLIQDIDYVVQVLQKTENYTTDSMHNINELTRILKQYNSLSEFIEHISLMSDIDNLEAEQDSIKVMTIHAAKGLEFSTVFLTGWEEGIIPYRQLDNQIRNIEEERRLAYVALTRAKNQCIITFCRNRTIFNQTRNSYISNFLVNLGSEFTKFEYI